MTTPNDMQAPTEIYVWVVPTKWGDGGSSFIHAWTDDPSRVQGLRDSIGLEPAVYRLVSRHDVQADGGNTIDSPYREAWDKGCDIIGALKTKNFLKPQAAEPTGLKDERAEFLTYWCSEKFPDHMRGEKWREIVDQSLKTDNANEKLLCAWNAWQARALMHKRSTFSEQQACTCKGVLGHARTCPMFNESMVRYEPFAAETKLYADYARIGEAFMDMCNDLGCPNDTNMLDWARDHITCDTCHGTGRICIGNSGQESDGNAPEFERCPSCGYGDASPSRERVEPRPDCCDTPSYCSSVRRCTAKDAEPPPAENSSVRNKIAAALHYPEHWDTAAYPTLDDAAWEAIAAAKLTCSECAEQPSERGEQGEAKGVCKRCGGTGFVDDGEITGVGGMEFENGPVRRVKDCPDCDASAPTLSDESADDIAVDSFARAMKSKMAEARAKGRSGWEGMDPADLSHMLRQHVEKGDPRDVANFCMMLWHHSAPIAPAVAPLTDMLKRMLSEFGDHHYHGCPQDLNHPTGACKCFAGALCDEARALLAKGGE